MWCGASCISSLCSVSQCLYKVCGRTESGSCHKVGGDCLCVPFYVYLVSPHPVVGNSLCKGFENIFKGTRVRNYINLATKK